MTTVFRFTHFSNSRLKKTNIELGLTTAFLAYLLLRTPLALSVRGQRAQQLTYELMRVLY